MPTHMFEVAKMCAPTASAAGWHVAHIFPVKDGNTDFARWDTADITRRFVRNIHPCNYFFIPKTDWQTWGGDPRVLAFFAKKYRERYASVWTHFLRFADAEDFDDLESSEEWTYSYSQEERPEAEASLRRQPSPRNRRVSESSDGVVEYSATRLLFKRVRLRVT
ncbi:MAG: hypothetical protein JWM41_260 [Gemmatimonadetes bacterium]|nr:hypothetical protein [Gemmatimonadota bacterium]